MATNKEKLQLIIEAQGIAKTKAQLKGMEKATGGATKNFALMAAGVAGATAALYALGKATSFAIRVGKEFEQSMANVKAISGATSLEFKSLEVNARKLGATTKFTASQVAGLQTEFSKLGFTATEINKVTAGTLALAAATGSELAVSAEVAGSTLRGFGLDARETGRVTDVMAKSFSSSALDMTKFSESMKFVAPISKLAGFEIEGTTAILGQLANAGLHGSMAGTALRSIFLKLADSNSALSKRLGGSVKSVDDLIPALNKLKDEGADLNEILQLTDKRAVTAFGILLDGTDKVNQLTESFRKAGGSAQIMADIQLDTLEGKLTIMKSATEGLGIALFDHLSPGLKDVVDGMTNLISATTSYLEIPTEEKTRQEMIEFNALLLTLRDVNLMGDNRNKIITKLQTKYGAYLENVDLEKDGYHELSRALKSANEQFLRKIRIEAQRTLIAKEEQKVADIMQEQIELAIKYEKVKQGEFNIWDTLIGQMITVTMQPGRYKKIHEELPAEMQKHLEKIAQINSIIEQLTGEKIIDIKVNDGSKNGDNGKKDPGSNLVATDEQRAQALDIMKQYEFATLEIKRDAALQELELINATEKQKKVVQDFYDKQRIQSALNTSGKLLGALGQLNQASKGSALMTARLQQGAIIANTASAAMAAITPPTGTPSPLGYANMAAVIATGLAQGVQIEQGLKKIQQESTDKKAQYGMNEIVDKPTMILAGEGAGAEHIQITPLVDENRAGGQSQNSPNITLNISAPHVDETIVDTIIPALNEAVRRGERLISTGSRYSGFDMV